MDTHTCETCGRTFRPRQRTKANRYCSAPCYHQGRKGTIRKENVEGRMIRMPGHPIAPDSGTFAIARLNLYEKIGAGPHQCHWCGDTVEWKVGEGPVAGSIIADHLNFDRTDDRPENLVASCPTCNAHRTKRGDRRLIKAGEYVVLVGGRPTRAVEQTCLTCGKKFAAIPALVRKGEAIYCSRTCLYNRPRGFGKKHVDGA